jgi:hypothetical protein
MDPCLEDIRLWAVRDESRRPPMREDERLLVKNAGMVDGRCW